ncbi:MAG TPA: D-alanyl-D-alanine carboxypeptidase/D-alanyl-D-alanine-endopeptidase [Clostridia bacterium]|nr:D-alanyl-D-alanine carboxypeptidase/D-alanyl-D-alanine-endopeptidase [Clostridia bacterium]
MRNYRLHLILFLLFALALQLSAAERKDLAKRVDEVLAQPDAARGFWGIEIVSLDSGKTLYSQNAEKLFTPASNTKLFTTAAALALVGPDHRFRTTIETAGTVDKYGRLSGDLVLVGRGDPNLSGRTLPYNLRTERKLPAIKALEELADQIVAKGVKVIDGDIVADDSYFAFERYGEGWSQDDLVWEWGAPVSALTINDNVLFVSILPADRAGDKAFVSVTPFPEYYRIDNRVMTTPPGTGPRKVYISREPGSEQLTLWGNIPLDDVGAAESLAIEDPADYAAKLLSRLLQRRGVVTYGRTRTRHTELAALSTFSVTTLASAGGGNEARMHPQAISPLVLGSYESAPIAQDLRVINKVSQNLHAEILLRLLGREKGAGGTIEGGLEVIRGWLVQVGIRPEEYAFYDGSGLSRQNLVTPDAVVKLLTYVSRQPWGAQFQDTLPVGGIDGSLADRFKSATMLSRVKAKTGSLGHVNALSGYATTMKGEHVAFSILVNNHTMPSKKMLEAMDSIVEAMVNDTRKK